MNDTVQAFLQFFLLDDIFTAETVTVLDFMRGAVVAFIALIFVLVMLRFVMEIIKILTDWSRWH